MINTCVVVDILGQEYRVVFGNVTDPRLETADGYCDFTTKQIVVRSDIPETVDTVADLDVYKNKVLRHEIVHAFLYESGLDSNSWGGNEEVVDCCKKAAVWEADFDFSDFGLEGNGVVHVCQCTHCGARIHVFSGERDHGDGYEHSCVDSEA